MMVPIMMKPKLAPAAGTTARWYSALLASARAAAAATPSVERKPIRRSAAPALHPAPVSPDGAPDVGKKASVVVVFDGSSVETTLMRPIVYAVLTSHGATAAERERACGKGRRAARPEGIDGCGEYQGHVHEALNLGARGARTRTAVRIAKSRTAGRAY